MNESCKKDSPQVQFIEIQDEYDGQRLDNFLVSRLKGVPKSHIYRIVRKGEVRVNKGRIKPDYRLQAGDSVRIPPLRLAEPADTAAPSDQTLARIQHSILYEDKGLLILNKPSGIAVHGGSGLSYGIIEALRALRPDAPFLELVHRLDRDTSGCLAIAKKRSVLRSLHELLRTGQVDKRYLALVKGRWRGKGRSVKLALSKNTLQSGERVVRVDAQGKAAESVFDPQNHYSEATLMAVKLLSGRTHQIRVHAAHSGHPLAGDDKYGDKEFNQAMRKLGLKRLFLHAHTLAFQLPETGQKINISAPLNPELQQFLTKLNPLV
ncbi:MAG TPA: 23S rRNA pseudouridine(955/2504/2580) synthase RluC [Gammaproteobacteria bacterium]|nr:23S rRNA pseudouridine(955/2504/2580) synthase RluC [Gammaproteobacteria bacterium]